MKKPSEELITKWMDGELEGRQLAEVEAYAAHHPELEEERAWLQSTRQGLREVFVADAKVPHEEFFLSRIRHEIEMSGETEEPLKQSSSSDSVVGIAEKKAARGGGGWRRRWLMPLGAAAAALVVGWVIGVQGPKDETAVLAKGKGTGGEGVVYAPSLAVNAELIDSDSATIIVLDGLAELPATNNLVDAGLEGAKGNRVAWLGGERASD